uniref:Uncharacterized protein n=1 Tax=Physcomitrium patens TaxID=3218 RepID=A0A2K1J865_PHYPA|nr:hypothetical protein PHYPA_020825 [Physcomitrium patens]
MQPFVNDQNKEQKKKVPAKVQCHVSSSTGQRQFGMNIEPYYWPSIITYP